MELALIAFDGLDPEIIYRNEDILPNFKKLMEESMHGSWHTPGHTIPSFTKTLTGLSFKEVNFRWDVDDGGYARHRQTGYDYLWDILDTPMTILNMPIIYPPEDIDDAMVCGFLAPDDVSETNIAKPPEVQETLNEMDYMVDIVAHEEYEKRGPTELVDYLRDVMDKRLEAAKTLIEMYDSPLFYGVWTSTDRWFHIAYMYEHDHMPMYYKADEILGEVMDTIPDDIPLVVFSDHGFRHYKRWNGVHKGHRHKGWYAARAEELPSFRDDTASIDDLFPTVVNYFGGEIPTLNKGRILFHPEEQNEQVKDRLRELGYIE